MDPGQANSERSHGVSQEPGRERGGNGARDAVAGVAHPPRRRPPPGAAPPSPAARAGPWDPIDVGPAAAIEVQRRIAHERAHQPVKRQAARETAHPGGRGTAQIETLRANRAEAHPGGRGTAGGFMAAPSCLDHLSSVGPLACGWTT